MNGMNIASLVLVGVGAVLILLGAYMSLFEWKRKHQGEIGIQKDSLGNVLTGLTKLLEALKSYPTGQRMIVFGVVVLTISGLFGGVSGLVCE